jgi:hypothetical protein
MSTTAMHISVTVHPPLLLVFRVISYLDTVPIRQFNFKTQLHPPPPPRTSHNARWETSKLAPYPMKAALSRAHSKTCRHIVGPLRTRSVVECGGWPPLSKSGSARQPAHSNQAAPPTALTTQNTPPHYAA